MEAPGCARRLHLLPLLERPGNVAVGGEKRTLPPPPSTPAVGKAGKQRRGGRREHCRRLHLLPLLGRQGNVAGVREGNTAAASICSRCWEGRETSPGGERGTLAPR